MQIRFICSYLDLLNNVALNLIGLLFLWLSLLHIYLLLALLGEAFIFYCLTGRGPPFTGRGLHVAGNCSGWRVTSRGSRVMGQGSRVIGHFGGERVWLSLLYSRYLLGLLGEA